MINKKISIFFMLFLLTQNSYGVETDPNMPNIETMDELQSKMRGYFEKNMTLQKALRDEIKKLHTTIEKSGISSFEKIKVNIHLNKLKELILEIPIARSEGEFASENLSENFIKNLINNTFENFDESAAILDEDLEKQKNDIQKRIAERKQKRSSDPLQNTHLEENLEEFGVYPLYLESNASNADFSTDISSQKEESPSENSLEEKTLNLSNQSYDSEEETKNSEDISNTNVEKEIANKETQTEIPEIFDQEIQVNFAGPSFDQQSTDKKMLDKKKKKPGYWDGSTKAYNPILSTDFPKKKNID